MKFHPDQPVTWDNPDIQLTELDGSPVPSDSLQPSHRYIIKAQIWDASFSPAIGTVVRCSFADFGFNSATYTPVQRNADGSPRTVNLDIPAWQNVNAEFEWVTPDTSGHYCLLVECSHPADSNSWNNAGAENTVVRQGQPGETIKVIAAIANKSIDRPSTVRFRVDTYRIPGTTTVLTLGDRNRDSDRHGEVSKRRKSSDFTAPGVPEKYVYRGLQRLLEENKSNSTAIPTGWEVSPGDRVLELAPGAATHIPVTVNIPSDALSGEVNFNIAAIFENGEVGGLTVRVNVED